MGKLTRTHKWAIAIVIMTGTATFVNERDIFSVSDIPLNDDEIELVEGFFGDDINADTIRKNFAPSFAIIGPPPEASVDQGDKSNVTFYGWRNHSWNYATANVKKRSTFMHEMEHLSENQAEEECMGLECREYRYTLTDSTDFRKCGFETRGAMVEDYVRLFLHEEPAETNWCQNTPGPERDRLLQKAVETRYPGAKKLRLQMQQRSLLNNIKIKPR